MDSVSATENIYFELTDPVIIPDLKVGHENDIELVFDKANKDKLIAFRIPIPGPDLQNNISAYQKAYRLTNLLTLKTGKHVYHMRPREYASNQIGQELKSIAKTPINYSLVDPDISDSNIQSLLIQDSLVNQQLSHFTNGIKALETGNFAEAIKEFYQVIEDDKTSPLLTKYRSLRDGLSHSEVDQDRTLKGLRNNFRIPLVGDSDKGTH